MLVLASASPRRRDLLTQLGVPYEAHPVDLDEARVSAGTPDERARLIARAKALACRAERPNAELILGADTIVAVDGGVLGKPRDAAEAARMLRVLAGREHVVWTGLALVGRDRERVAAEATRVWMRSLDDRAIAAYVACGEWSDKAGGYAIQGRGAAFVTRIEGCYYNVVGLPLARLADLLAEFGMSVVG